MTYDPRDPVGSMAQHVHDERRHAALVVAAGSTDAADCALLLSMLGLHDTSLLGASAPRELRKRLTQMPAAFVP